MKRLATLGALALLSCSTLAASFDCAKAASAAERLICTDPDLSRLDDELSAEYQRARRVAPDPRLFQEQTRAAWRWREANCASKACLLEWYAGRQSQLKVIAAAPPSSNCLRDGDAVTLSGRVSREVFPGPPNYQSVAKGDRPTVYWILVLADARCFSVGSMGDREAGKDQPLLKRFQLVFPDAKDYDTYRAAVGAFVSVMGELSESHTAHHKTPALLTVKTLSMAGK